MAISLQRVIRSTLCLVLWLGFRGRRIERRYLRFEQIQDGSRRHVEKISSGDISATGRPIHFMFGYKLGFSGTADLMALFSIWTNLRWRLPPSWIISNGHISISPQQLTIYLYSAHRAVIFAIAQLSCTVYYWKLLLCLRQCYTVRIFADDVKMYFMLLLITQETAKFATWSWCPWSVQWQLNTFNFNS